MRAITPKTAARRKVVGAITRPATFGAFYTRDDLNQVKALASQPPYCVTLKPYSMCLCGVERRRHAGSIQNSTRY